MINNKTILVTGGAGFIGSNLISKLLRLDNIVICLDNFDNNYSPLLKEFNISGFISQSNYSLLKADICDESTYLHPSLQESQIDYIIHLAAVAGVRPSIQNPVLYSKVNIEGTIRILDFAARNKIDNVIIASSSSVYGNNTKVPFSETDVVDFPISPYAATKKAIE